MRFWQWTSPAGWDERTMLNSWAFYFSYQRMSSEKLSEPKLLGIDQSLRDLGEESTTPAHSSHPVLLKWGKQKHWSIHFRDKGSLKQWFDFEHTLGDSEGQGSLACYSPRVTKSWTWLSNWTIKINHWTQNASSIAVPYNCITQYLFEAVPVTHHIASICQETITRHSRRQNHRLKRQGE